MHGSAAVIGLQMLPVLGTVVPPRGGRAARRGPRRGLPAHQLPARRRRGPGPRPGLPARRPARRPRRGPRAAAVEPATPAAGTRGSPRRCATPPSSPAASTGEAAPGLAMLDPVSRPCIRTAFVLYGGILDAVRRRRIRRAAPPLRGPPPAPRGHRPRRSGPGRRRPRRRPATLPGGVPGVPRHAREEAVMTQEARRTPRLPLRLRRGAVPWERQRPTWRDAKPALHRRRPQGRPRPPVRQLVRPRRVPRHRRPDRAFGTDRRRHRGRRLARRRRTSGRRARRLPAPRRAAATARCACGTLVCHWHGLALDGAPFAGWEPFPAHDDGVLAWVRLDEAGGERPLRAPGRPRPAAAGGRRRRRPHRAPAGANPRTWSPTASTRGTAHGSTRTPSSTSPCSTPPRSATGTARGLRRRGLLQGRRARGGAGHGAVHRPRAPHRGHAHPDGEGQGSVVETHATPLGPDDRGRPRTAVIEAVVATSRTPRIRPRARGRARPAPADARRRAAGCGATTWPTPNAAGSCAAHGRHRRLSPGLTPPGRRGPAPSTVPERTPVSGPPAAPPTAAARSVPCPARSTASGPARPTAPAAHWPRGSRWSRPAPSAPPGNRVRTRSPATTTRGSGVCTVGRSRKPPTGNSGQSARHSCRWSMIRAP